MKKREKGINQINGANQVAMINSSNNNVTIINNPVEYMSYLIKNGKLEEVVELLSEVNKKTETLHPMYPHYTYNQVKIGSKIAFKHTPVNEIAAKKYPLKFKGKLSITDPDFNNNETIEEFLTRKHFLQEKVSIDVKYIETWIGEQLIQDSISLEQQAIKDGEWFIIPKELPSPVKAKLVMTEETDIVIIDYLELRVTNIDKSGNKLEISNSFQKNSPIQLVLTIPISSFFDDNSSVVKNSKFNIQIRENFEGKLSAEKIFLEFMKYAGLSSKMKFIDIEKNKVFFSSENLHLDKPEDFSEVDDRISLLKDLKQIQDELDVEFKLSEIIYEQDFEMIQILKSIIEDKEVITKIENLNAIIDNKEALEKLISDVRGKPFMISGQEEKVIKLFGVSINLNIQYKFENLVVKDLERVKRKLEILEEGETAKIDFVPGTKNKAITRYSILERE
ncbi:hypothetical protein [Sporosarcina sp. ITBMC105]